MGSYQIPVCRTWNSSKVLSRPWFFKTLIFKSRCRLKGRSTFIRQKMKKKKTLKDPDISANWNFVWWIILIMFFVWKIRKIQHYHTSFSDVQSIQLSNHHISYYIISSICINFSTWMIKMKLNLNYQIYQIQGKEKLYLFTLVFKGVYWEETHWAC